jgi:PAS domain S-box-containing protein
MAAPSRTDTTTLDGIIAANESWLTDRILLYAKRRGYTRYTPTLREAWRQTVTGLSATLLEVLTAGGPDVEIGPDQDDTDDPLTRFGITEAQNHRERGVDLGRFLGLMKYYRKSYMDLVDRRSPDPESRHRFSLTLHRLFDRLEISLCTAWHAPDPNGQIADLKRANRTITNKKNKYLTIFESLQSPAAVLDQDSRIDTVNHSWTTLFGDSETSDAGKKSVAWFSKEIDDFVTGNLAEQTIEKRVDTTMGKRHLSIKIKRMLDVSEKFSGCVIILDDRTHQKQIESKLKETTLWLMEMFNALEEAVFIGTPTGHIMEANRAAEKIFGYTCAELKDQTTEALHVDHDHFVDFNTRVKETLEQGENADIEYVGRRKNGEVFPFKANISILEKEDDTPLGIVSVLRDISALKMAEAATRNSERLQGVVELAGTVCHDMNQPLMAITGYAELILMDCPEDAPHFQKLKKIAAQVDKVATITKKLMHVTRYETKTYLGQQIIDIEKASCGS